MKKIIIGLFVISILFACNSTPKTEVSSTDPKSITVIKFEKELYNFGKITEGDKATNAFIFKNTGTLPLIITNATATCGCTVPNWPKEPINPGETGKIDVVFNSAGKKGLQDKVITITANTSPAETTVHMMGEVLNK